MASSHDSILTFLLVLAPPSSGADLGLTVKGQKKKKKKKGLQTSDTESTSEPVWFLSFLSLSLHQHYNRSPSALPPAPASSLFSRILSSRPALSSLTPVVLLPPPLQH